MVFPSLAAAEDAVLFFDNPGNAGLANGGGGSEFQVNLVGAADVSTEVKKFGEGSLHLQEDTAGISQVLDVSPFAEWTGPIEQMSIVCWVYLPSSYEGKGFTIADRWYLPTRTEREQRSEEEANYEGDWRFHYHAETGLRFFLRENQSTVSVGRNRMPPLLPEEWVHFAMTFDHGKIVFYLNGVPVGGGDLRAPIPATSASDPARLRFHAFCSPGSPFPGPPAGTYVDDFGYFDRVLQEDDVSRIVDGGLRQFFQDQTHP